MQSSDVQVLPSLQEPQSSAASPQPRFTESHVHPSLAQESGRQQVKLAQMAPAVQSLSMLQMSPSPQPSQVAPPQSMSDSSWFLRPSPQPGTWQMSPWQMLLMQSLSLMQPAPSAQFAGQEPPQSTSVSSLFSKPSVHEASAQVDVSVLQARSGRQSTSVLQAWPTPHLAQGLPPPQSTPVSSPLAVLSSHVETRQLLPWQTRSTQSLLLSQFSPSPQRGAHWLMGPPQSIPVSRSFETWSPHIGGSQLLLPLQTPLLQSLLLSQLSPSLQVGHPVPPQSRSVSSPLMTPSPGAQAGARHSVLDSSHTKLAQSLSAAQVLPAEQR